MEQLEKYENAIKLYEKVLSGAVSAVTLDNYSRVLNLFGRFYSNSEYTKAAPSIYAVAAWKENLAAGGCKASTIRLYLQEMKIFFEWAKSEEIYTRNPIGEKIIPKVKRKPYDKKKILSYSQVNAMINPTSRPLYAFKQSPAYWARNRAITIMLVTSGLRSSELCAAKLCDLDFDGATITVPAGKGDKYRVVGFPAVAQTAVREYLASGFRPHDLAQNSELFGTWGKDAQWNALSRNVLSQIVERNVKIITGVSGIRGHALRHSFASYALAAGMSIEDISEILGHTDIKTTEIYLSRLFPASSAGKANIIFDAATNGSTAEQQNRTEQNRTAAENPPGKD